MNFPQNLLARAKIPIILFLCVVMLGGCSGKNSFGFKPQRVKDGQIVYYVKSGKSYHSSKDCPTLARSKNIFSAALDTESGYPRADACDVCVKQK